VNREEPTTTTLPTTTVKTTQATTSTTTSAPTTTPTTTLTTTTAYTFPTRPTVKNIISVHSYFILITLPYYDMFVAILIIIITNIQYNLCMCDVQTTSGENNIVSTIPVVTTEPTDVPTSASTPSTDPTKPDDSFFGEFTLIESLVIFFVVMCTCVICTMFAMSGYQRYDELHSDC